MTVFSVEATVVKSIPLIGWSGSFLAKIAKSYFPKEVIECGFSLSPLIQGGKIVLSGVNGFSTVLEAGSKVFFRFTFFCRDISSISKILNMLTSSSLYVFKVDGVEFQVFDSSMDFINSCSLCGEAKLVNYIDSRGRGLVEVFFGPTMLMFRGWRILYPSPQRLVYTLAKSCVDFLGVDPRIAKKRARTLSKNIDVISFGTKVVDVSIGRNRKVKAFMGKAIFGVQGLINLRDFVELLEVGRVIGAGRSRGIGFGYIEYRVIEPRV